MRIFINIVNSQPSLYVELTCKKLAQKRIKNLPTA